MTNLIYGIHSVDSAVRSNHVDQLFICKDRNSEKMTRIIEIAQKNKIPVSFMDAQWFKRNFSDNSHQFIAASSKKESFSKQSLEDFLAEDTKQHFFLILDEVQDPHNLGACFRIASAFDLSGIIVPKNNSVGITPVVSKVASGAVNHIPFFSVTNLSRTIDLLKEHYFFIYAADGYSELSIYDQSFSGNVALVMGSEGRGIRRLTKDKCDLTFSIPMSGSIESLNVSVATGICVSEIRRKLK
jgi:23S rRNA (guanosine2251-2'-O)-methyltransferase